MKSEWWRGAIIYQVYPRSFFDANEDGTGDLAGITGNSITSPSLGVDAIWISPFFKSPMRDFGYDVGDYRIVDPIFGTNADFNLSAFGSASEGPEGHHRHGPRAYLGPSTLGFRRAVNPTIPKADWYVWG